jgi:hypothetical protein
MELNNNLVQFIELNMETIRGNIDGTAKVLQVERVQLAFKEICSLNILLRVLNLDRKKPLSFQGCDRDTSYLAPSDAAG